MNVQHLTTVILTHIAPTRLDLFNARVTMDTLEMELFAKVFDYFTG